MWHGVWRPDWGQEKPQVRLEWRLLRRVFAYFLPYWSHALVVLACIGVTSVIGLVPAFVTQTLIDCALKPHASFSRLLLLIGALIGASLLGGVIGMLQSYFSNLIRQGIMLDLRNQLFGRMLQQSVAFFTKTKTGDVMSRLSNDVNSVQSVVSDTIFSLVMNVIILATTVAYMVTRDWRLTVVALVVLPAFLLPAPMRAGRALALRRLPGAERQRVGRHRRDLRDRAPGPPLWSGRLARQPARQRNWIASDLPTPLRIPRHGRRDHRQARRESNHRRARRSRVRRRDVHVRRQGQAGAGGGVLPHRAGPAGRAGRAQRRRQDDDHQPPAAFLRPAARPRHDRRPGHPRRHRRVARAPGRDGLPGHLPLPFDRAREPPLRAT